MAEDVCQSITRLTAWMLQVLDDEARARCAGGLRTVPGQHETPGGVLSGSAAWLVTARRS
ncbi:MAG TPA: hypothetical protein VFV41_02595 [Streptosporangiaceae bacterium]|nr:hypothetical protein [Streptosporangiaceae bacterium]